MTQSAQNHLVAAAMRNEGAFIVEWLCWYRMLGFDVLVATNDCTDHSPALLDALTAAGWVTHITHRPPDGLPPKKSAYQVLGAHLALQNADWVLVCDVDEFLVLHNCDDIAEYLGPPPHDFGGVALSWKTFGTGGHDNYAPGLTHRQFTRAGKSRIGVNRPFKSIFRNPAAFSRLGDHTPHGFQGEWADPAQQWLNGDGYRLPQFSDAANHPIRHLDLEQITHRSAQMNHYVLRSVEHFAAKRGTPSASAFKDRYTEDFFARRDRNGTSDTSALRFQGRFDAHFATAMALPEVARLHHLCCADYVEGLCARAGTDHRADTRWQSHLAQAG